MDCASVFNHAHYVQLEKAINNIKLCGIFLSIAKEVVNADYIAQCFKLYLDMRCICICVCMRLA